MERPTVSFFLFFVTAALNWLELESKLCAGQMDKGFNRYLHLGCETPTCCWVLTETPGSYMFSGNLVL